MQRHVSRLKRKEMAGGYKGPWDKNKKLLKVFKSILTLLYHTSNTFCHLADANSKRPAKEYS